MLQVPLLPYLYLNYKKDAALQAIFAAARSRVVVEYTALLATNLPDWQTKSGAFLDFVGMNLYGFPRPSVPTYATREAGPYNTLEYNTAPYDTAPIIRTVVSADLVSDDVYKRCIQWRTWLGDSVVFNLSALRERCARWLGVDYNELSLTPVGTVIDVAVPPNPLYPQFKFLLESGVLPLPLGFSATVSLFAPVPPPSPHP